MIKQKDVSFFGRHISFFFLLPAFILFTAIFMYPTAYSLYTSFFQYSLIHQNIPKLFRGFGNYLEVLADPHFQNSLFLTGKFIGIVLPIETLLGMGLALLVNRERTGMRFIRIAFLIPMMMTPVTVGLMWRFMYNPEAGFIAHYLIKDLNWLGSIRYALYACASVDIWQWTPFMFLICFAGLRSLAREPIEAAVVDGASRIQIFWYVTLPLLKRVLLIAITLRLLDALKIFDIVYIMTRGGPARTTDVFSILVYRVGLHFFNVGYAAAMSWIFLVIALGAAIILLRICKFEI